jgi:threonine/homoserine/homoserine lactone efflux protein
VVGFSVLLASIHNVEGLLWFAALTLAARPLAGWLRRPKILTLLNRLTGGVFILFGARLAFERKG